jgi:hypothetical protein
MEAGHKRLAHRREVWYNTSMEYIYKKEKWDIGTPDYAIRYTESWSKMFAKHADGEEFATDFADNNTGYDIFLSGKQITEAEYAKF